MSQNLRDPRRRGPNRTAPWLLWGSAGVGACAIAAVAILMIVTGWGHTPGPAPVPPKDFSIAAAEVPDPVTGPVPQLGEAPAPQVGVAASDSHATRGAGPGRQTHAVTGTARPAARPQMPSAALRDDTVVIPALGVDAPVGTSGIDAGELVLPRDVGHTTEWDGSAPIGGGAGTILVAGHVNDVDQGEGALWQLHLAQPGDAVYLVRDGVVTRWKITAVTTIVKSQLPQDLFVGDHGPRLLKLVTCGGALEHTPAGLGYYQDNVIATAVPF